MSYAVYVYINIHLATRNLRRRFITVEKYDGKRYNNKFDKQETKMHEKLIKLCNRSKLHYRNIFIDIIWRMWIVICTYMYSIQCGIYGEERNWPSSSLQNLPISMFCINILQWTRTKLLRDKTSINFSSLLLWQAVLYPTVKLDNEEN